MNKKEKLLRKIISRHIDNMFDGEYYFSISDNENESRICLFDYLPNQCKSIGNWNISHRICYEIYSRKLERYNPSYDECDGKSLIRAKKRLRAKRSSRIDEIMGSVMRNHYARKLKVLKYGDFPQIVEASRSDNWMHPASISQENSQRLLELTKKNSELEKKIKKLRKLAYGK